MEKKKRFEEGDLVHFIGDDSYIGRIKALTIVETGEARGLPGAEVEWIKGGTIVLALGWLVPIKGNETDGF